MGNVSVREEGGSSSGVGVKEGQYQYHSMPGGAQVSYHTHSGPEELMGQSPPHSPSMATRSPLVFTPQVPMVPLQRADEPYISSPWVQNTSNTEYMISEQGIPSMITWSYGGKEVAVAGSWDNWKTRKPLQRSGKDFTIMKVLPSGFYQYRFFVDGEWRHAPDLPAIHDDRGIAYNYLDLKEFVPEEVGSIAGFEPPQSPESSYDNMHLSSEDFAKEPPAVPPHLQMTLLNVPTSVDGHAPMSRPQHVVLDHLYVQKGRSGQSVAALGSTSRFRAKYVTVVLYKSLQR